MVSTTTIPHEMKNIKVETSTTQKQHEIEYVDVELFSEDEEMKVGNGKVLVVEWVENFLKSYFNFNVISYLKRGYPPPPPLSNMR
jgi:hypothetical protein